MRYHDAGPSFAGLAAMSGGPLEAPTMRGALCANGHPRSTNTILSSTGKYRCHACHLAAQRRAYAVKRARRET